MADLATLRVSVDSREVKAATNDLNNLSRASGQAERAATGLSNAAKLFGGALAAAGIFGLVTSVAKANAEFQSLNASLKVATGSSVAATAAFNEIKKFAATTPYQLNQTVEAFLKLKNLGLDPSMAAMRSYGNTAASMGKSLNQMIEAVADASTMEFERLKEFGIKAKQQKDTVTFTFQGVATTVKKNSEEIQQYLMNIGNTQFAGAMDEQMKTLNGRMSNLKDNIDNLYVSIGNAGATNIFTKALDAASAAVAYLTNNLNSILRAIEITMVAVAGMAAAFIALRVALGVQAIVLYVTQMIALNIALGATTTASAFAAVGIKGLQAALASTGWGLALVAIGALVGAIYSLATAQSRAREETNGHIASLKALAQARSVDWAQKRSDMEIEARLLERDIRLIRERNAAQAVGQGKKIEYITPDLAAKRERLDALRIGIQEADVLKEQADAMAKIAAPAAAASAGIAATGNAAKKAEDPLKKYRDALVDMVEENKKVGMTPEQAKAFDVEKLALAAVAEGYVDYAKKIRDVGAATAEKQARYNAEQIADGYLKEAEAISKTAIELKQMEINQKAATVAAGPLRDAIIANGAVLIANMKAVEDKKKADEDATKAADEYKKTLEAFNNLNIDINFDALFGDMGKAMGGVVSVFDQMLDRQEKYNDLVKLGFKDDATRAAAQQRNARLQINQYANLVSAAKGFFKQGTTGYKAMEAAEKAFRLFELAMAAKSAAVKIGLITGTTAAVVTGAATETAATAAAEGTKTGITLAGAAARIPVKIAEGAASMFASLGPLGFAAVAAMVGVMAAFGFTGGGSRTPPKYNTGTGTVMGDPSAQSESLTKSIERLADIDRLTMRYSAQMASSLKSIEANIGGLTSLLVRTGDISASGAGVKTGTSGIGDINKTLGGLISKIPVLGTVFGGLLSAVGSVVNALFGTRTSIIGQGLSAVAQTMADIVSLGFEAENFTNVQRRSRFLGITVRTRYSTETTDASDEVNRQFTLILKGFYDAISAASNPLGLALNDVQERLNNFVVNIGQIDLQGLTGQEIQEKLTAVFGAAADSMARAAITGLDDFQKVGEGYFETIVRVASGVEQAQQFLRQLGVQAIAYTDILNKQGDVTTEIIRQSVMLNDASAGIAGGFAEIIGNAEGTGQELFDLVLTLRGLQQQISATGQKAEYMTIAMISAAGGLDAFQSGLQSFYDDILTDSERSAIELARLTAQFQSLGVAMPASREAFKTLIQSIDITTAAGQALYGSLIALTPAFVDLIENTTAAGEQIDLSNQRRELEIRLMEAQGNASGALAARRALELAAMDETLRSLQQQIWAAEDARAASEAAEQAAKAAADAAAKIATERTNLEIQLMEALGNASGALAARRALELAAADATNRALLTQIYTAQDAAKAAQELADAQAKAAQEAAAAAEAAASLARDRRSLEIELMEALGNSTAALTARRALELEGMDATLRGLQQQIWAAEDAAKATQELAEAQARAAELARERRSLEIELMDALGNSSGALAARRALELEGMDVTLRALQQQIWAAEDAAKAAQELADAQAAQAELARQRQNLEIQLMEELGNASGALAARRSLELAAMDESLRGLQMQIYAAQDARAASEAAAQAAEATARIATERTNLEIQLMEALGNSSGALAARRALELAATDESNRALLQQIYTAQDAAKAAQELADAQAAQATLARQRQDLEIQLMEALGNSTGALNARRELELAGMDETLRALQRQIYTAQDAARATQELADAQASAAALARQRRSLEIELMDIQGNTAGATAARRALELEDTDETLRALREQIFAAQDARAASEAAAEAAARAAEEQARAMEAAAAEQARALEAATALNRQRRELEIDLLEAQGFAVQALAARRALELEGMDASLRALKEQIYAAQAKAEEDAKAAQVLEDAANAMKQYQDALANVTETVMDEIKRLRGINASSSSVLLKAQFATLTAQARTGNLDALGKLPELSRAIEEATIGTATSALEVARIRAWLDASLSETLAQQSSSANMVNATSSGLTFDGNSTASANAEQTSDELSNMSNVLYQALYQVARNTGKSYELLDRWDGDGLPDIREDASDYY